MAGSVRRRLRHRNADQSRARRQRRSGRQNLHRRLDDRRSLRRPNHVRRAEGRHVGATERSRAGHVQAQRRHVCRTGDDVTAGAAAGGIPQRLVVDRSRRLAGQPAHRSADSTRRHLRRLGHGSGERRERQGQSGRRHPYGDVLRSAAGPRMVRLGRHRAGSQRGATPRGPGLRFASGRAVCGGRHGCGVPGAR